MDILLVYVEIGLKAAEVASTWQHHFVWLVRQQATAQYSIVLVWLKLSAENKKMKFCAFMNFCHEFPLF